MVDIDKSVSMFSASDIVGGLIETSQDLGRETAFQIVDEADGDAFRVAGQAVLDIARHKKTVKEFSSEFGDNAKLGLSVTEGLAGIIALTMESDQIVGERNQKLADIARGASEAVRSNLQPGETWQSVYNTFRQETAAFSPSE
ncbi:hypothetical protein KKD37_04690 [Patescibacteria group bacterium]|nr:hypothetical protein [Patescibacteria group bacterium]